MIEKWSVIYLVEVNGLALSDAMLVIGSWAMYGVVYTLMWLYVIGLIVSLFETWCFQY